MIWSQDIDLEKRVCHVARLRAGGWPIATLYRIGDHRWVCYHVGGATLLRGDLAEAKRQTEVHLQ